MKIFLMLHIWKSKGSSWIKFRMRINLSLNMIFGETFLHDTVWWIEWNHPMKHTKSFVSSQRVKRQALIGHRLQEILFCKIIYIYIYIKQISKYDILYYLPMSMLSVIYFVYNRTQVWKKEEGCSELMANVKFSHSFAN